MTLYGYARVSVREPEDKNLDLQVERLVRAGCSLGNIRAEEASGARNDRGGLLELLDLVVEADTLVVTHIDRLSRGLTHGLQVIEGLPSFCAGAYHGVGWNHNATNGGDGTAEEQKGRDVLEKLLREIATGTASGPVPTATERMRAAVALASLEGGISTTKTTDLRRIINGDSSGGN